MTYSTSNTLESHCIYRLPYEAGKDFELAVQRLRHRIARQYYQADELCAQRGVAAVIINRQLNQVHRYNINTIERYVRYRVRTSNGMNILTAKPTHSVIDTLKLAAKKWGHPLTSGNELYLSANYRTLEVQMGKTDRGHYKRY